MTPWLAAWLTMSAATLTTATRRASASARAPAGSPDCQPNTSFLRWTEPPDVCSAVPLRRTDRPGTRRLGRLRSVPHACRLGTQRSTPGHDQG